MDDLFISHSSADDAFVRRLRLRLEEHAIHAWIDSRELLPGDLLEPGIARAIESAPAFVVVISPHSFQSPWVSQELKFALALQKRRGRAQYSVIPLSLDGTKLGVFEGFFDAEPLYLTMSSAAGGVDAGTHALLVALGKRLPLDNTTTIEKVQQPVAELRLELTDLRMQSSDAEPRASARARIVYESGMPGEAPAVSSTSWQWVAPLGAAELEDLRWYLETFARWPHETFRGRAQSIESQFVDWGYRLYSAALPAGLSADVQNAWTHNEHADRRFSVLVDTDGVLDAGIAATLLRLPWELLHDGKAFLLEGARPVCIRRRLASARAPATGVISPPIRLLIVSARPEDDTCDFFDHRASTLPLVDALEGLGDLVESQILAPPTLSALREELDHARLANEPYHMIHFDGYGAYDRATGICGLCLEDPQDVDRLSNRRHVLVPIDELGTLLRDQGIASVVLDARRVSDENSAHEAIAAGLLQVGIASIVTTRYPALSEAARRFVTAFYSTIAGGGRVGDAVLQARRLLKDDNWRGRFLGVGDARITDWFNLLLYQEKDDVQLFRATPSRQTEADIRAALTTRLGRLPASPAVGLAGRSRVLLSLERLLQQQPYAHLRGPVGAGKTALAVEFARWMVRSRRFERAAFVALERHTTSAVLLKAISDQLIGQDVATTEADSIEASMKPVERALLERSTLILLDGVEHLLPPRHASTPDCVADQSATNFSSIAALCERLVAVGQTRILFTCRESLPAPFDGDVNRIELRPLFMEEAVELVERVLARKATPAIRGEIEELVGFVHGHAGTLSALGGPLLRLGVAKVRAGIGGFLTELERENPGDESRSPLAGVEHALNRLSLADRARTRTLAPFCGGVQVGVLANMNGWDASEVVSLISELVDVGLGTLTNESYLALVPALTPYLRSQLAADEWTDLETRWQQAFREYGAFLMTTGRHDAAVTAARLAQDIPNFLALLDYDEQAGNAEVTVSTATSLVTILERLEKPLLVDRITGVLAAAARALQESWSHGAFQALDTRIQQLMAEGQTARACEGAARLLELVRAAGPSAYADADFDLATACFTLARALGVASRADDALPLIDEARSRFEDIHQEHAKSAAATMAAACILERADCLAALGRFDEAADLYEESMAALESLHDERSVAVAAAQFGSLQRRRGRFAEALAAFDAARERFGRLNEPASVAQAYGESGRTYSSLGRFQDADVAMRKALEIWVRIGEKGGEARELDALASLYADHLNRPHEAIAFYLRGVETFAQLGDLAREGSTRSNLADTLFSVGRLDEARAQIEGALHCKESFGNSLAPWTSWEILGRIEMSAGNADAAAKARQAALDTYISYRRAGGEDPTGPGRLTAAVERQIHTGGVAGATQFLRDLAADSTSPDDLRLYVGVLESILNGNRDRAFVEAVNYAAAAEAILLMETLDRTN